MSDTPRTDAASQIIPVPEAGKFERCIKEVVAADFARKLERELTAALSARPEAAFVELVRKARAEGWYEDNPGWDEVDAYLAAHGPQRDEGKKT